MDCARTDEKGPLKTEVISETETIDDLSKSYNPDVVDFAEHDASNPVNWSGLRKWPIVAVVAMMNMVSIFATTTIVPAAPQVMEDLHATQYLYTTLLVSIWELGEGVGPFFIGPLSEKYGRLPIFHVGNLLGMLCSVAGALSVNISMLIAFRFFNGVVLSALVLGPAIIGDLFRPEQRGVAMSFAIAFQMVGTFVAPICGSFAADHLGWRWSLWLNVIAIGAVGTLGAVILRETYAPKILERRAARLREETGNDRLRPKHQADEHRSSYFEDVTRPMQIFFRSPAVALVTFYAGLAYSMSYIIVTTITEIMEQGYGFGRGVVGLVFIAPSIGILVGLIIYGSSSDRYIKYKANQSVDGKLRPEHRLLHMVIGACALPLALLFYGWTLAYRVQWVAPMVGVVLVTTSVVLARLPTDNYLVDAFEVHGASAIAASVIWRAILGAVFPLTAPPLYRSAGLGWGNSVLALIAAAFIPLLVLLVRCGTRQPPR